MIERNKRGHKTANSRAAFAVLSLPHNDEVSDKLELLERQYWRWLGIEVAEESRAVVGRSWYSGMRRWLLDRFAPLDLFRTQIEVLANGYGAAKRAAQNTDVNQQFYKDYERLVQQNRELRLFLHRHYPKQLDEADSLNTPLLMVAKAIMLKCIPPERIEDEPTNAATEVPAGN